MNDFAGRWFTTFGTMDLEQTRDLVRGSYQMGNNQSHMEGTIKHGKLTFHYREPAAEGEGWFVLERPGRFAGEWRPIGGEQWSPWVGVRGFEGVWDSSFGPMKLLEEDGHVLGFYEGVGSSSLQGQKRGDRLEFQYREPEAEGIGWFEMAPDGMSYSGQWKATGQTKWSPWMGRRLLPVPGLTWLVVLEAHWQTHLADQEYAFGHMLREFFARVPGVKVRQRFFTNAEGLEKWCREIMYLPEQTILVIASHGTPAGLKAQGDVIPFAVLAQGLRYADNLRLLHFSSCLTMENKEEAAWNRDLHARFPISGYRTSVDWAASALTEFLFLDMVLSKGLTPAASADQVVRLLAFAGDKGLRGSPYPPAGFRYFG
jgi:hypothetical protein